MVRNAVETTRNGAERRRPTSCRAARPSAGWRYLWRWWI